MDNKISILSASGDTSRWDAAAAPPHREAREGGVWVEKKQIQADAGGSSGGQTSSPARRPHGKQNAPQVPPSKKSDACLICKSREHLPVRCPQAFCERCNKLGHLASVCTVFLPWECIAPMCAFQAKGQGFYYIHDSCTANQLKERSNNIVVTIVEGETSTRQMELDLSDYLATGWRCSAHAIGPGVFVVRFPNPRAVAQICYVGTVTLKTTGTVIRATNWSSAVGAKGVMEVAWVKVSNVPLDKRSERNLAYVASLVGVPLEIDNATLHRPASARVKLGCRNVDELPVVAESVLGGHFYDFYYEVEQVLIRDPDREKKTVHVSPKHDGKRNREGESFGTPGAKQGRTTPGLGEKSPIVPQQEGEDTVKDSQESFESDDSLHNTLLIETMASELLANNEKVSMLPECHSNTKNDSDMKKKSYSDVVKNSHQVDDVVEQEGPMLKVDSKYTVESPETQIEVIPTPPLVTEENLRFSLRNVQTKMGNVEERALVLAKKRDLEGTSASHNSFDALSGPMLMLRASQMGVNIPDSDFTSVDVIRELEIIRNMESLNTNEKNDPQKDNQMFVTNAKGDQIPLDMTWSEERDVDEDNFTVVRSRKKKERKPSVVIPRPITRSQKEKNHPGKDVGKPTQSPSRDAKKGGRKNVIK